jgi:hypothetical protein
MAVLRLTVVLSLVLVASVSSFSLQVIPESVVTIVNSSHPGSVGNKHGYEDGSVVRVGNVTHMMVSELIDDPMWIRMRLGHWMTTELGGDSGWTRIGTLVLDGKEMISTANCSDPNDVRHNAALWSPTMYFEDDAWYMNWVGYNCGKGYSNANTNGEIKLAKSSILGSSGVGGPFVSQVSALLAHDESSQPWEGKQGVDSFFPFRSGAAEKQLLAFYGSSPFGWPWNVGLARSKSGSIRGPWERLPHGNPLALNGGHTENPIVLQIDGNTSTDSVMVMVHDFVAAANKKGFGMSVSSDGGVSWGNSTVVEVPGGCEAPLGILPSLSHPGGVTVWWNKRGSYDNLYAAQFVVSAEPTGRGATHSLMEV